MLSTTAPEPQSSAASIELEGVGVCFPIPSEKIVSFKEYVLRRLTGKIEYRKLWAVKAVDLEVRQGETFGIVGRNGAGKSTLLKVVSRVLRPTTGRVIVRGRTAPLLELGAGFHFDLTGRENVFLNASLFGYPKALVQQHIDEVVEFSELARFIDLPIRNYSTGMLARLGFSVATMFRPDILILDEVLTVGDSAFQEKCIHRIKRYRREGTTIILVSHQAESVAELCSRALWLDQGQVAALGPVDEVLGQYERALAGS